MDQTTSRPIQNQPASKTTRPTELGSNSFVKKLNLMMLPRCHGVTSSPGFVLQEDIAAANLSKARKLQADVEEAEERADMAEQAVAKLRAKLRS